jgi:hypothetical protein
MSTKRSVTTPCIFLHRDLYRVLVEPDCEKGKVEVVDVVLVAVDAESDDLALSNVHLEREVVPKGPARSP